MKTTYLYIGYGGMNLDSKHGMGDLRSGREGLGLVGVLHHAREEATQP